MKVIPRFQQYEGANKIVQRVVEGKIKKGLIWHFQGSGKSLLMVFAHRHRSGSVMIALGLTDLIPDLRITLYLSGHQGG